MKMLEFVNPEKNLRQSDEASKQGKRFEAIKQYLYFSLKLDLIGLLIVALIVVIAVTWSLLR